MYNVPAAEIEVTGKERHDAMGLFQLSVKRGCDVLCSLLGLLLLWPFFLVIALLLKRQDNGAVFFRQERIGRGGKPFLIYKFRTMSSIVEDEGPRLVAHSDDSNSTALEQFLRCHHLDELPQLWNVLRGDMSLVGPRPERKYFIDKITLITDRYSLIYEMKPGLTSEATLYNGYTDTLAKMLRRLDMDIDYMKRRSLWLDLKIIIKTACSILSGKKF